MMKTFLFLAVAINSAISWRGYKIVLQDVKVIDYNKDVVSNLTVGVHKNIGHVFMQIKKDITSPVYIGLLAYQKSKNGFDNLTVNVTSDLCKYFDNPKTSPIVNAVFPTFTKKGNFPRHCPIKSGNYIAHGIKVDEELLPPYIPGDEWKLEVRFSDKNNIALFALENYVMIDHTPGKDKFSSLLS